MRLNLGCFMLVTFFFQLRMFSVSLRFLLTLLLLLSFLHPVENLGLIGGSPLPSSSYPFFALVSKGNEFCGGTVISANAVLTAAHCIYYESLNRWAFFTELHVLHGKFSPANEWYLKYYSCEDYLLHLKYDPPWHRGTSSFDIAILKLRDRIADSPNAILKPCRFGDPSGPQQGTFFGLGPTNSRQLMSTVLRDNPNCANADYYPVIKNPDVQICFDNIDHASVSIGDAGGSLVYQQRGTIKCLFGVFSFSTQSVKSGNYTNVFTNAQFLNYWISLNAQLLD